MTRESEGTGAVDVDALAEFIRHEALRWVQGRREEDIRPFPQSQGVDGWRAVANAVLSRLATPAPSGLTKERSSTTLLCDALTAYERWDPKGDSKSIIQSPFVQGYLSGAIDERLVLRGQLEPSPSVSPGQLEHRAPEARLSNQPERAGSSGDGSSAGLTKEERAFYEKAKEFVRLHEVWNQGGVEARAHLRAEIAMKNAYDALLQARALSGQQGARKETEGRDA